jgi:hypothetical protein
MKAARTPPSTKSELVQFFTICFAFPLLLLAAIGWLLFHLYTTPFSQWLKPRTPRRLPTN